MADNEDHVLSIGFQGKKALAGLKAIEDSLERIDKLQSKMSRTRMPRTPTMPTTPRAMTGRPSARGVGRAAPTGPAGRSRLADTSGFERTLQTRELRLEGLLSRTDSMEAKANLQSVINQIRELRKEASKTSDPRALKTLRDDYAKVGVAAREASRQITISNKAMTVTQFTANSAARSVRNMASAYISVFAIIEGFRGFLNLSKDISSLNASMLAASGSAEQAEKDFSFITDTANTLGRDLKVTAKGFQQIGAATRGKFSLETTKEVFLAASEASTAFGLSVSDSEGVMRAFSQIASKGTVNKIAA